MSRREWIEQLVDKHSAETVAAALFEIQAEVDALRALHSVPPQLCTHRVREPVPHLGPRCMTCGQVSQRVNLAVRFRIKLREKYRLPPSPYALGHTEDLDL